MLRYVIFSVLGPLVGLLLAGIVLQPPVVNGVGFVLAFVVIGFLPALVPALVTALVDEATLKHRRGFARYALVALTGSATTLAMCALTTFRVPYFPYVLAAAGGISAALCCWLHLRLRGGRAQT